MKLVHVDCGYKDVTVLRDVTYEFEPNKIYGVVGHNGAGKTTMLRTIMGLLDLKNGEILDYSAGRIAYVPERQGIYADLTVYENIKISLDLLGGCDEEEINTLLNKWNLTAHKDKLAKNLSTGLQARVKFITARPNTAQLLICDEPTLGVDARTQKMISSELNNCRKRGGTVIVTSHNLNFIESLCDEIIIINNQKMVYSGSINKIRDFESVYLEYTEEDNEKCD